MTNEKEVKLANEILSLCERYDEDGLTSKQCYEAVGVAQEKLKELGWDRREYSDE